MRLLSQPLAVEILLFLDEDVGGDLDNMIKPILDAMNRVVYDDDHQIVDVRISKYFPGRLFKVDNPTPALTEALSGEMPVVYVKLTEDV